MMQFFRRLPRLIFAGFWVIGSAPFFSPIQSTSQTFVVTTTNDTLDGACDSHCSLREAIQAANANPGVDTITFGLVGTQTFPIQRVGANETNNASGDFNIRDGLILNGNGEGVTVIDGMELDRVFYIHSGAAVTMTSLTITGGLPPPGDNLGGGGILNFGTLTLDQVTVSKNSARQGGGISNALSRLVITNSTIEMNVSTHDGGGIYSDGDLELRNTNILNNEAGRGGGVNGTQAADMLFYGILVSDNTAATEGGGIYNDKEITIIESVIQKNLASVGGGIYSNYILNLDSVAILTNTATTSGGGIFNDNTANLTNVTITANSANGDPQDFEGGGGIYNNFHLNLYHVTFYGNSAADGATLFNSDSSSALVANSILARNGSQPNCKNYSPLISLGRNIEDVSTCGLTWIGDLRNTDPKLGVLATDSNFNTPTHRLLAGSPAIDNGRSEYCAATDQRRVYRPVDGNEDGLSVCDIGAYEAVTSGWVSFNKAVYDESDGVVEGPGPNVVSVLVTLDRETGKNQPVSVDYANKTPALYDFVPFSGTLNWGTGDSSPKIINITILDDEYNEPDKIIEAILSNARYGIGIWPIGTTRLIVPANDPLGPPAPPPLYLPMVLKP